MNAGLLGMEQWVGGRETNISHLDITQKGTCQTESKATAHEMGTLEKELSA